MQNRLRTSMTVGMALGAVTLVGCASSVPRPDDQLAATEAAIAAAEGADARETAPVLLNSAQEKLLEARTKMSNEQYRSATWLLEDAEVEANLAQAKAKTAETQRAVTELKKSIQTLQEQLNNQT